MPRTNCASNIRSTREQFGFLDHWSLIGLAAMLLALLTFIGCTSGEVSRADTQPRELAVFAAASLSAVFPEIGARFETAQPGVRVRFNFAGSQRLRTQLEYGAEADVFASADDVQMTLANDAGLLAAAPVTFATNSLALVIPAENRRREVSIAGLCDLARERVQLVMAQSGVPAGRYTLAVVQNLADAPQTCGSRYGERVAGNVVSMESNVRSVVHKVALGEADAGFVYVTDVSGAGVTGKVEMLPIPEDVNVVAVYPVAALKDSHRPDLAAAFVAFLQSEEVQTLLSEHGFGSAPQ